MQKTSSFIALLALLILVLTVELITAMFRYSRARSLGFPETENLRGRAGAGTSGAAP